LTRHLDTVHLERREHACPYCPGIAFGRTHHLTAHIDVVHLKLRYHACPYCPGVAFGHKDNLKRHVDMVHNATMLAPTAMASPFRQSRT
jgi:hypothetical protein